MYLILTIFIDQFTESISLLTTASYLANSYVDLYIDDLIRTPSTKIALSKLIRYNKYGLSVHLEQQNREIPEILLGSLTINN